jgi:hypothetical protein
MILSCASITATNARFTRTVKHGEMTSVADAGLLGTESAAATGTGACTGGSTKNVVKRIGYIGSKRYVSANAVSTVTAATPVAATVLLSHPDQEPVAT